MNFSSSIKNAIEEKCRAEKIRTYSMCLRSFLESVNLVDPGLQLAGFKEVEQFVHVEFQFFPSLDIPK
jgi:hypothetical protein